LVPHDLVIKCLLKVYIELHLLFRNQFVSTVWRSLFQFGVRPTSVPEASPSPVAPVYTPPALPAPQAPLALPAPPTPPLAVPAPSPSNHLGEETKQAVWEVMGGTARAWVENEVIREAKRFI
jgi:hypothetical protein